MNIRYPKSFFKLLAAGFLLAVLPLVAGLLVNMVAIQRLSDESQRALYSAARVVHATRELSESATSLERAAQQSVILDDETIWDGFLTLHDRFVDAGAQVAMLGHSKVDLHPETHFLVVGSHPYPGGQPAVATQSSGKARQVPLSQTNPGLQMVGHWPQ